MDFSSQFTDVDWEAADDEPTLEANRTLRAEHEQKETEKRLRAMTLRDHWSPQAPVSVPVDDAKKRKVAAKGSPSQPTVEEGTSEAPAESKKRKTTPKSSTQQQIVLPPVLKVNESTAGGYSKGSSVAMFRATYPNAEQLGMALATLRGTLEEYELYFERRTGLSVVGCNVSHTIYVELRVPATAFAVFNLRTPGEAALPTMARFSVLAETLYELRKEYRDDYTLTLTALLGTRAGVEEDIGVHLHPAFETNARDVDSLFSIPQIDTEHVRFATVAPWTIYQFRVVWRTAQFKTLMLQMARYTDTAFRLTNAGVDVCGYNNNTHMAASKSIRYTTSTKRDTVLSAYDVFASQRPLANDSDEADLAQRTLPDSELAVFESLRAGSVTLCHLDRLVQRQVRCTHMDCVAGETEIDADTGNLEVDAITGQRVPGPPTCERHAESGEVVPLRGGIICSRDSGVMTRAAAIDSIRFHSKFLNDALTMVLDSEHVELFFGRCAAPDDHVFAPMLMRGRLLDGEGRRIMLERCVYVMPCEVEK